MEKILTYVFKEQTNSSDIKPTKQFDHLFNIKLITLNEKSVTAEFMWKQIVDLVVSAKKNKENKIILCKGIEVLNCIKNTELLFNVVTDAVDLNAKLLIGSLYASDATLIPLTANLFWTDSVSDFEFLVIYDSCFDLILNEDFSVYNSIAECLENITSNKMLIYPMVNDESNVHCYASNIRMERLMQMHLYLQNNKLKLHKND